MIINSPDYAIDADVRYNFYLQFLDFSNCHNSSFISISLGKFGGGLVAGLSVSFVVSVIVNAALSYKIVMVYCRE